MSDGGHIRGRPAAGAVAGCVSSAQVSPFWRDLLTAEGRPPEVDFSPQKRSSAAVSRSLIESWPCTSGSGRPNTHVVPRYPNDPAPGGPIAWEAIFRAEPVPETELQEQANGLRRLLRRVPS